MWLKNEYVQLANAKHNYKFSYNIENEKIRAHDKIEVVCPFHGGFLQRVDKPRISNQSISILLSIHNRIYIK